MNQQLKGLIYKRQPSDKANHGCENTLRVIISKQIFIKIKINFLALDDIGRALVADSLTIMLLGLALFFTQDVLFSYHIHGYH